jgi:hypothetical protein
MTTAAELQDASITFRLPAVVRQAVRSKAENDLIPAGAVIRQALIQHLQAAGYLEAV